jgi:magnesium transporter
MFRKRFHAPGTAPATLVAPSRERHEAPKITLVEYDEKSFRESELERIEDAFACRDRPCVSWINVDGLGDLDLLQAIAQHFGLHPLAIEDVLDPSQRPKVEEFEGHFFIVNQLATLEGEEGKIRFEQSSMFVGRSFLITMQDQPSEVFETIRSRLRRGRGFARSRGHDYLAYALIDATVDHFFPVLESLGEKIEILEDELIENPTRDLLGTLHDVKRALLQIRRASWPEREIITALSRDESGLILPETRIFLRDCYDHTVHIMDVIESYRDLTSGMMDLYLSSISHRTNEVVRVLTVVTAIFIPLTFIAGVYGMNFDPAASPYNMPELHARFGYPITLAVMASLATGLLIAFKRRHWL